MKFLLSSLATLASMFVLTSDLAAAEKGRPKYPYGLGLTLGTGIGGLSGYASIDSAHFAQGSLGFGIYGGFAATADYAFIIPNAFKNTPALSAYYGIGALVVRQPRYWFHHYDDRFARTFIGVRIPIGLQFHVPETRLQLSGELAPGILIAPGRTYVFLDVMLSVRFLF